MGETGVDDQAISGERFERLRVAALERLNLFDTPGEERFDRITRIARELFGVPVAEINFLNDEQQFTKSPQPRGAELFSPLASSFCEVTIRRPETLVVEDATKDERFASRDTVTGPRHIRFYAGTPLTFGGENRVGTLCLVDTEPREFSDEQRVLLEELGDWVERELQDTADLDRAAEVQQQLLPHAQPGLPAFEVAGVCIPSRSVAGDFYSWHGSDDAIELTLADVMGKGTAGAILAATVRSAFRSQTGVGVLSAVQQVNEQLAVDLSETGSFATLFHARIDLATGRIAFADAGHGLTVVVHPDGSYERLEATGLPIGIVADGRWTESEALLTPGDRLITFTDGLLDLYDGTLDSLDEIAGLVAAAASPAAAVQSVSALVAAGAADDDVTAVVVFRA
jgi:sigma-B regulation protein RsbU (phosphoserine phosphatase)